MSSLRASHPLTLPYRSVSDEQSNDDRSRLSSDLHPLKRPSIFVSPEVFHVLSPSIDFRLVQPLKTLSRSVTFDEMSPETFAVSRDVQPEKASQKPLAFSSIVQPLVSTEVRLVQSPKE